MARRHRMNRLLQGDVGAGKTLVALHGAADRGRGGRAGRDDGPDRDPRAAASSPTSSPWPRRRAWSSNPDRAPTRARSARRSCAALAAGDIQILVGTHAVFQEDVTFADLRLAIVDEQHRFGVAERCGWAPRGRRTDVLVMTATPIPRTLSLAQYGDMDVSVLDEKPPGRSRSRPRWSPRRGSTRWWPSARALARGGRPIGSARWSRKRSLRRGRGRGALRPSARRTGRGQGRAGPWPDASPAEKDAVMARFRRRDARCWWRRR
jgi:ATP-dependent DNA helicase RecG